MDIVWGLYYLLIQFYDTQRDESHRRDKDKKIHRHFSQRYAASTYVFYTKNPQQSNDHFTFNIDSSIFVNDNICVKVKYLMKVSTKALIYNNQIRILIKACY